MATWLNVNRGLPSNLLEKGIKIPTKFPAPMAALGGAISQPIKQVAWSLNELSRLNPLRNTSINSGMGPSGYSPFSQFNKGVKNLDN